MRSVHSDASAHAHRARTSLSGLVGRRATGTGGRGIVRRQGRHASGFLRPFARRPLRRFIATMDALTSRSHSQTAGISLLHAHDLPDHSVSNPPGPAAVGFTRYPSPPRPPAVRRVQASPFGSRLAEVSGRIEFVSLRTGRSPPVALHGASRPRSYRRLQAGERLPGGDFHPSGRVRLQAHCHRLLATGASCSRRRETNSSGCTEPQGPGRQRGRDGV